MGHLIVCLRFPVGHLTHIAAGSEIGILCRDHTSAGRHIRPVILDLYRVGCRKLRFLFYLLYYRTIFGTTCEESRKYQESRK